METTTTTDPKLTHQQWADAFNDSVVPTDPADRLPSDPYDDFWFGGAPPVIRPGVATQKTIRQDSKEH